MNFIIKFLSAFAAVALLTSTLECGFEKKVLATNKISELRSQVAQLDKQRNELNSRLNNLKNDLSKKKEYRDNILRQMNTIQEQINIESQKVELLESELIEKQIQIDEIQNNINDNMDVLCKRLNAIYKSGEMPELAILLGVESFDDFLDKADLIQKLSKYDSELINNLKANIFGLQEEKNSLQNDKDEIERSKATLYDKRQELNNLQLENEQIINDLQSESSSIQNKINENNSRKRSLENIIANSNKNKSSFVPTSDLKKGKYIWPVPGYSRISSPWGDGRNHNGIDIPAPQGTKVVAMADGVVVKANATNSWGSGWGYHVRINHGDGYETISAHLSKVLVSQGQSVKAGQVIGLVGNTGHSFGNHLHCGTAKNGRWYNPRNEI